MQSKTTAKSSAQEADNTAQGELTAATTAVNNKKTDLAAHNGAVGEHRSHLIGMNSAYNTNHQSPTVDQLIAGSANDLLTVGKPDSDPVSEFGEGSWTVEGHSDFERWNNLKALRQGVIDAFKPASELTGGIRDLIATESAKQQAKSGTASALSSAESELTAAQEALTALNTEYDGIDAVIAGFQGKIQKVDSVKWPEGTTRLPSNAVVYKTADVVVAEWGSGFSFKECGSGISVKGLMLVSPRA